MWLFRAISSSTFIMSYVQSIYLLSSIRDWYLEVNIWTTDKQCSFYLWMARGMGSPRHHKRLKRSTWVYHVLHNTCTMEETSERSIFGRHQSCYEERIEVLSYQTRWNAIILPETLPAYSIPKVVRMETGEVIYEKVYRWPRPPPKIYLKHDWKRELGSEHAQQPEGQVGQLSRSFQSNQQIPSPSRDRSGQPVVRADTRTVQDGRKTSRSQEIEENSFHEEGVSSDRSGQPVVETKITQTRSSEDSKSLNVELAHERSGQPVVETNTENMPDGCQTRSCHESIRFNVGDKTLRERSG